MKVDLDQGNDDAQIQIVPLIDVIFCILTFFILAVVQLQRPQGVNVDVPKAETGTVQPPERLIVTLSPSGQVFLGQQETDRASLENEVKKYLEQKPQGVVVLNASQNAFYNDVIGILDLMRKAGGNRVALATNPPATPSPTPNPFFPNPGLNNPGLGNPGLGNPGLGNPGLNNPGLNNPGMPISPGGLPGQPTNPSNSPLLPGQPSGSDQFPNNPPINPLIDPLNPGGISPSIAPTPRN